MIDGTDLHPAQRDDADWIAKASRGWIEAGLGWRWRPARIRTLIADTETEVVVARRGGALVGFAVMEYRFLERAAHLVLLGVEPDLRRRGLGSALVDWLEVLARRGGIERVSLEVRAASEDARAFYRRLGYREVGVARGYYDGREDAVRMARDPRPAPRPMGA